MILPNTWLLLQHGQTHRITHKLTPRVKTEYPYPMFENLINQHQLSALSDDALLLKLIDFEASTDLNTVSARSLDILFQEAIKRNSTPILGCVLEISEHRCGAAVTRRLLQIAELTNDGGTAIEVMDQLYQRSLNYEVDDYIYITFIRKTYSPKDGFGQPARTYAAKSLLLLGVSQYIPELIEIFHSETLNDYVKLNLASTIYLATGQGQYLKYVQAETQDENPDFAGSARECLDDILEHQA